MLLKYVEGHCNKQWGSCDVSYSDRGPSCVEDSQIAGSKGFFGVILRVQQICENGHFKSTYCTIYFLSNILKNTPSSSTTYPKSLCVADLLFAERLFRPKIEIETLLLL